VSGLLGDGIDLRGETPQPLSDEAIDAASQVVVMGCDLGERANQTARPVIRWDDLPAVSDGYAPARDAIVARLEELMNGLRLHVLVDGQRIISRNDSPHALAR